jgi:hypothetical protein
LKKIVEKKKKKKEIPRKINNMKILILNFRNAGYFHRSNKSFGEKDRVFELNGHKPRKGTKQYKNPITVHQISNVLHVLFGERPAPSLRESYLKPNEEIKDIALNSYLKINPYGFTSKSGKFIPHSEKITKRKAVWNSYDTGNTLLYWERIRKFLSDELYLEFIEKLKLIFKVDDPTKDNLTDVIEKLHYEYLDNPILNDLLDLLLEKNKRPLYYTIKDGIFNNVDFNKNNKIFQTTNFGVGDIVRLNGRILVPISDEKWIDKLKSHTGFATILDGGMVSIVGLKNDYEISESDMEGFTKVSEISDEYLN